MFLDRVDVDHIVFEVGKMVLRGIRMLQHVGVCRDIRFQQPGSIRAHEYSLSWLSGWMSRHALLVVWQYTLALDLLGGALCVTTRGATRQASVLHTRARGVTLWYLAIYWQFYALGTHILEF